MEYLETLGFEVTYLPVNENGQISMDQFKKSLREETILVSMMYGNMKLEIDYRLLKLVQFLKIIRRFFIQMPSKLMEVKSFYLMN